MIHTARTVRTLQAVAMIVGLAVFFWSTGLPTLFHFVEASAIINASDTLSSSAPGLPSDHTITFTTPNGLAIGETFSITFDPLTSQFDTSSIVLGDVDLSVATVNQTLAGAAGAGTWGVTGFGTDVLTFETPTDTAVGSTTTIVVLIGQNATGGTNQIVNPSATTTSYRIDIGGTMQDSGQLRVAIVDQVIVSANVDTTLTFTVSGVDANQTVNGSPTTTIATSTSNSLPFGTLTPNVSRTLAHDLAVTTNAKNGYTVTVEQSGDLQSTTGGVIDGFIDGNNTTTPSPWQAPAALVTDLATYGHWGLTSTDGTTSRSLEFGSDEWVSGSTTPIVIMGEDGPADGLEPGIGAARIGYQVQISPLQEAGDDYNTTLRYIATPRF